MVPAMFNRQFVIRFIVCAERSVEEDIGIYRNPGSSLD